MTPEEIVSRAEIHHVLMTYCRGVDRSDIDLLRSVYHPDGIDNHGPFSGSGDEFADYAVDKMAAFTSMGQHHITNTYMEINGDRAAVESYFIAYQPYDTGTGEQQGIVAGRYLDLFECREGRWAISRRDVVMDWSRESLPGPELSYIPQTYPLGQRGEHDPSTELFRSIREAAAV